MRLERVDDDAELRAVEAGPRAEAEPDADLGRHRQIVAHGEAAVSGRESVGVGAAAPGHVPADGEADDDHREHDHSLGDLRQHPQQHRRQRRRRRSRRSRGGSRMPRGAVERCTGTVIFISVSSLPNRSSATSSAGDRRNRSRKFRIVCVTGSAVERDSCDTNLVSVQRHGRGQRATVRSSDGERTATADDRGAERTRAARATAPVALFLVASTTSSAGVFLQAAALGKQLFDITDSELALGLLGLVEFLPALLLLPLTGSAADRFDRRRVAALALRRRGRHVDRVLRLRGDAIRRRRCRCS